MAEHGLVRYASGEIVTFDVPGAMQTFGMGINAHGDIAGMYLTDFSSQPRGFLRKRDGSLITFGQSNSFLQVFGINARGQVVGVAGSEGFIAKP